jgi:hypothetical protein
VAQLLIWRFRRRSSWATAIDDALRSKTLERLRIEPGFRGGWVGRREATSGNERAIVTTWSGPDTPDASTLLPTVLGTDVDLEGFEEVRLPLVIDATFPRSQEGTVLRIFTGRVHPGSLDVYFDEAQIGVVADGADPMGPIAVYSGQHEKDRFITASIWTSWASLQACTGGDIHQPLATRNADRIVDGGPVHYEILAEAVVAPSDGIVVGALDDAISVAVESSATIDAPLRAAGVAHHTESLAPS